MSVISNKLYFFGGTASFPPFEAFNNTEDAKLIDVNNDGHNAVHEYDPLTGNFRQVCQDVQVSLGEAYSPLCCDNDDFCPRRQAIMPTSLPTKGESFYVIPVYHKIGLAYDAGTAPLWSFNTSIESPAQRGTHRGKWVPICAGNSSECGDNGPVGLFSRSLVEHNGFVYAFGGLGNYRMWAIDPTHGDPTWTSMCEDSSCGSVPTSLMGTSLVSLQTNDSNDPTLVLFGGFDATTSKRTANMWMFDFGTFILTCIVFMYVV